MAGSRVAIVRSKRIRSLSSALDSALLTALFQRGFELLTGLKKIEESVASVFKPTDFVGLKINTIGGKLISTRPETALSLAQILTRAGLKENRLIIWDRTNRELREAGFRLQSGGNGFQVFATDTAGAGYDRELISSRNIGSMFSVIQKNMITTSVSLAVLKDHGLAGITAGLKNYFGAIHNPNKYHDQGCNPYIAELFDTFPIKSKHKLTIIDCLTVQCHKGPSFHAKWAEKYGGIILSFDPVAADRVGWLLVEKLRAAKGLPTLAEERREPAYLKTAEKIGLGTATLDRIELIEDELP